MTALPAPVIYPPQGILTLISRAWTLVRVNLKVVLLLMAVPAILNTLFHILLSLFSNQAFLTQVGVGELAIRLLLLAGTCVLIIPVFLAWLISYGMLCRFFYLSLLRNTTPSLKECFQHLRANALPLMGMTVLLGLMFLGLLVVTLVIFYLGMILVGFTMTALMASSGGATSKLMMGIFALVVGFGAFVLLVSLGTVQWFLFNFPILSLLTNTEAPKKFWRHIGDSYQLLFKSVPRVLLFSIGFMLLSWSFMGVLMGPVSLWMGVEMSRTGLDNHHSVPLYVQSIWNIWSSLANCLIMPFHISALTLFWYDCQTRAEGLDLKRWLNKLQQT
ncbi:hypothetical protein [Vampirovibrio sp.]|uniref:hypothetical protein n=1 Tax=Vampirovibrio sp. TaxID=2717857 RepID=UPI0035937A9F